MLKKIRIGLGIVVVIVCFISLFLAMFLNAHLTQTQFFIRYWWVELLTFMAVMITYKDEMRFTSNRPKEENDGGV